MAKTKTTSGPAKRRPLRAVAYLRVSTSGQAERGMGLQTQRDRVREHAAAKGYQLVSIVQEAASGGVQNGEEFSYEHRPVLLSLIGRAEAGDYDVLLVAKLDRLSRDFPTLAVLERRLQRFGVEVVSASEENGDGPLAEFVRGQLALVAQLERAMILERVAAGRAKRKAQGRHVQGTAPYGYRSAPAANGGRTLVPVTEGSPSPIDVVRRIFAAAKAGSTPGRIATDLNTDAIPGPTGKRWNRQTIRNVIENPAYAGERHGVKNAHEPIVSRRLFNASGAKLNSRSR